MIRLLSASPAERRMLDLRPLSGPTPWLVAIMTFSICLIAAAGLGLASTARLMAGAVEQRYALEVPATSERVPALLDAVRSTAGAAQVQEVSEAEMRAGLRRWLGAMADSRDLPVPALINFDLADAAALPALERRLKAIEPAASLTTYRGAVGPVLDSLRTLVWVALALALLLAAAAAAAIVLAARADLDSHRPTIDILHDIGATDRQIAGLFQRKISIDALTGGAVGALAAALVLLILAAGSAYLGELTGGATLGALDLVLLAAIPLLLAGLASLVARAAVLGRLRQAP